MVIVEINDLRKHLNAFVASFVGIPVKKRKLLHARYDNIPFIIGPPRLWPFEPYLHADTKSYPSDNFFTISFIVWGSSERSDIITTIIADLVDLIPSFIAFTIPMPSFVNIMRCLYFLVNLRAIAIVGSFLS